MRLCTALVLAALVALPAAAQVHVESEDGRVIVRVEDGEVIIEQGGPDDVRVRRFSLDGDDWSPRSRHHARALRLRLDSLDFEVPDLEGLAELKHLAELEALREFDFRFEDGFPEGVAGVFALGGPFVSGLPGASAETRREVRERERALADLARRARRAEGAERQQLERELDRALEEQFALRQRARREGLDAQRERLERQRERLEKQAEALREQAAEIEAREAKRREVIRERRQELLGDDGDRW